MEEFKERINDSTIKFIGDRDKCKVLQSRDFVQELNES